MLRKCGWVPETFEDYRRLYQNILALCIEQDAANDAVI
jgi:hypothetical protein